GVDRLTSRQFSDGTTPLRYDFTYTARNQVATLIRYSDLSGTTKVGETDYTYDAAMRVTNILHKDGSNSALANYTYTYDLADRVTVQTENGTPKTYQYDNTDQLTQDSTATYTYDANGNRTMTGYATGANNQLLSDGTWTYTYDSEGNRTTATAFSTGEKLTYSFDNQNRLLTAKDQDSGGTLLSLATYVYDVFGNLIENDVWTQASGTTTVTRFAYLDMHAWADLDGSSALVTRRLWDDAGHV